MIDIIFGTKINKCKKRMACVLALFMLISSLPLVGNGEVAYALPVVSSANGEEASVEEEAMLLMESLGYHGMKLDDEMLAQKADLKEELIQFDAMEAGEDYVEQEFVICADNRKEAQEIADCYQARLVSYDYGIGVIRVSDETDMGKTLELASESYTDLPAVYPNTIFEICETETTPNDPVMSGAYSNRWHHDMVDTLGAWSWNAKGQGVTVAVLDTGADLDHEDLKNNLLPGKSFVTYTTSADDDHGHGSHVAGLVAAEANNGKGSYGVAPEAKIIPIKVMNSVGKGSLSAIATGVNYVVSSTSAKIINLSIGSDTTSTVLETALNDAVNSGIVVTVAAGNSAKSTPYFPASMENVIAVGGIELSNYYADNWKDGNPRLYSSSNYGDWVDIAAPAKDVYSATKNGGYGTKSGTSMACPMVAGAVADMISVSPTLMEDNTAQCTETVLQLLRDNGRNETYTNNGRSVKYGLKVSDAAYAANYEIQYFFKTDPTPKVEAECYFGTDTVISGEDRYMKLSTACEEAQIFYTLDGTTPSNKNGELYQETGIPLRFAGTRTVKAVAMYHGLKSEVMEYTADFQAKATAFRITSAKKGTINVPIGGSVALGVEPVPQYARIPELNLICENDNFEYQGGKIFCKATAANNLTVPVRLCAVGNPEMSVETKLVSKNNMKLTLSLPSYKNTVLYAAQATSLDGEIYPTTLDILKDTSCSNASADIKVVSTKPDIIAVREDGILEAKKPGSVIVKITATWGTQTKTIKRRIQVVTPVYAVNKVTTSTGFGLEDEIPLAIGGSLKLYYCVNDDTGETQDEVIDKPGKTEFVWTTDDAQIKVKGNSKIVCSWKAIPKKTVTVTAVSKDNPNITFSMKLRLYGGVSGLVISKYGRRSLENWGYGVSKSVDSVANTVQIKPKYRGENNFYSKLSVTSTNPNVLRIEDGYVKAVGIGTAKLIFRTVDGSGKKLTVGVKVR